MSDVRPFTRDMIKDYLEAQELNYLVDKDGDYRVDFRRDAELDVSLRCWIVAEGEKSEMLKVAVYSDRFFPKDRWGSAIMLCNTWNRDYRWPKAYVLIPETGNGEPAAEIVLERQIDLEHGVHAELLDRFITGAIAGAITFWQWAVHEQGM